MRNLYDLLGVRPDDDAETIKKAFRKAAKASHPDHHGDDPEAAARFRRISQAYEILGNPEQRAAYDRLLEFERAPLRHQLKRSFSDVKRHVVQGVTATALLAIVVVVGYEWFVGIAKMPGDGMAGVTTRRSAEAAAGHQAEPTGAAGRDRPDPARVPQMPIIVPTAGAAADHGQPHITNVVRVSNPAGQTVAVTHRDGGSDVPTGAGVSAKTEGEPVRHANDHDQPQMTNGAPDSNPARPTIAVAHKDGGSDAPSGAGVPARTEGDPLVRQANDHDQPQMTNGAPVSNPAGQTVAAAHRDGSDVPTGTGIAAKTGGEPVRQANDHDQPQMTNSEAVSNPARQTIAVAHKDGGSDVPTGARVPGTTETEPVIRQANDHDEPQTTNGDPVSKAAGQGIAVAVRDSGSDVPTGAGLSIEPPVDVPSLEAPSSAKEDRTSVPAANDKRDGKTAEPAGASRAGVKLPGIRKPARTPVAAKRDTPSHRPLEQAELENRSTPAPTDTPSNISESRSPPAPDVPSRIYGVGF